VSESKASTGEETKEEGKEGGGPETKVLEKGHLFFFYRPKVAAKEVHGPDDVQKFYLLMSPEGAVGRPAKDGDLQGGKAPERTKEEHTGKPLHRLLVISALGLTHTTSPPPIHFLCPPLPR
jgi:hypothetical protein